MLHIVHRLRNCTYPATLVVATEVNGVNPMPLRSTAVAFVSKKKKKKNMCTMPLHGGSGDDV